jgi:hypothetical protein
VTVYDEWLTANDRFLAGAVAWIRERLERFGEDTPPTRPEPPVVPEQPRARFGRRTASRQVVVAPTPAALESKALPPGVAPGIVEAEQADDPPPLILLSRRLGLSAFERNVMLLAVAMELDTGVPGLCARAQHDPELAFPTFALAMTVFDDAAWEAMSPERPLRRWQLVEVVRAGFEPLTVSRLRADDRVVAYVKGLNHLDERLRPILRPVPEPGEDDLSPSQAEVVESILTSVRHAVAGSAACSVQLLGSDSACKRLVAQRAAQDLGFHLFNLAVDDLPLAAVELDQFARLWQRESLLAPVALYVDAAEVDRNAPVAAAVRRWLHTGPGLVLLDVREPWPDVGDAPRVVDVARPTPGEQLGTWVQAVGDTASDMPARLSAQFDLDLPTIRRIAHDAGSVDPTELGTSLWRACLAESRPTLDRLAQRLDAKATWDDLQLPAPEKRLLHQIVEQVDHRSQVYDSFGFRERMSRGLGITVLFAGESGTGKTMAAEVLANALDLMLYRIDLSAVVDKYIGETEKNLRRLFDAAEGGGAILFFDEADALFGKRSEVKDSHDRYANIEINYLLQRIESYRGLAILATNLKSAMDTAFMRRLRFVVNFPFPGTAERTAIWAGVLPQHTPRGNLDLDRLARLNLTGGSIHNVALNAAFAAAASGGEVTMPLLLDAARTELRKLDKPVNEADFRWLESARGSA